MKKQQFESAMLAELRALLPWGAQKEIARRLKESGSEVSQMDVHKVLHGITIRYGKVDPASVINVAKDICKEANDKNMAAKNAALEVINATKSQ